MICIDPSTKLPLKVLQRHTSAVRCLGTGYCIASQRTLLLSGGLGFKERPTSSQGVSKNFGYVLVWESNFGEQIKYLERAKKRRMEWLLNHGESNNGQPSVTAGWKKRSSKTRERVRALKSF